MSDLHSIEADEVDLACLCTLADWHNCLAQHEDEFLERFCAMGGNKNPPEMVTQIAWNESCVRFTYVLPEGQHIADRRDISEWLDFYYSVGNAR